MIFQQSRAINEQYCGYEKLSLLVVSNKNIFFSKQFFVYHHHAHRVRHFSMFSTKLLKRLIQIKTATRYNRRVCDHKLIEPLLQSCKTDIFCVGNFVTNCYRLAFLTLSGVGYFCQIYTSSINIECSRYGHTCSIFLWQEFMDTTILFQYNENRFYQMLSIKVLNSSPLTTNTISDLLSNFIKTELSAPAPTKPILLFRQPVFSIQLDKCFLFLLLKLNFGKKKYFRLAKTVVF